MPCRPSDADGGGPFRACTGGDALAEGGRPFRAPAGDASSCAAVAPGASVVGHPSAGADGPGVGGVAVAAVRGGAGVWDGACDAWAATHVVAALDAFDGAECP